MICQLTVDNSQEPIVKIDICSYANSNIRLNEHKDEAFIHNL